MAERESRSGSGKARRARATARGLAPGSRTLRRGTGGRPRWAPALALLTSLGTFLAAPANAAISVYSSHLDNGTNTGVETIRGRTRVHVYFNNGIKPPMLPASNCTALSDGDEICQWAVRFETTGDLIISDIAWNGSPVEDDEPTSPASLRNGTGGNAVNGNLGETKLATVSLTGTHGELLLKTPGGYGFVNADGSIQTIGDTTVAEAGTQPWTQVSATTTTFCGTVGSGEAYCWGTGYGGAAIPDLTSLRLVAAGASGACGLDYGNTIHCWGSLPVSPPDSTYLDIASGADDHVCGLKPNLDIECWGGFAASGLSFNDPDATPPDEFSDRFRKVTRGDGFACGIRLDGSAKCIPAGAPTPPATSGFVALEAAGMIGVDAHVCGLLGDGSIACFGDDTDGQSSVTSPTLMGSEDGFVFTSISVGESHSCATYTALIGTEVSRQDEVWCWGDAARNAFSPDDYVQLSLSDDGGCGVTTSDEIKCWGVSAADPADVPYVYAASGNEHTCIIASDGELQCWGDNGSGQAPGSPPAGPFMHADAGEDFTCAVAVGGTVSCFGEGGSGQTTPDAGTYTQVVTGATGACGLEPDATVECWGSAPNPSASNEYLTISAGTGTFCGILDDLALDCWGTSLGASPPAGAFADVTVGDAYACAMRTSGVAECWGTGLGAAATPVGEFRDLSAGGSGVCSLRENGKPNCWGDSKPSEPVPTVRFASLDSSRVSGGMGADHSCGAGVSGAMACWGDIATTPARMEPPLDSDADGLEDPIDNCPEVDNGPRAGTCVGGASDGAPCTVDGTCTGGSCSTQQEDSDFDGIGDVCDACDEPDSDGFDRDSDGVPDACDNCPNVANALQDPNACAPALLYVEGVMGGGAFAPLALGGPGPLAPTTEDHYAVRLKCPNTVDIGEVNVGFLIPSESIFNSPGCGDPLLCSPAYINFDPNETGRVDGAASFVYWPGEVTTVSNENALFLHVESNAGGFCTVADTIVTLAEIIVGTVPTNTVVTHMNDEFDEVESYAAGQAESFDSNIKYKTEAGAAIADTDLAEALGPDDGLKNIKVSISRVAETEVAQDNRNWLVQLESKVDVGSVVLDFYFEQPVAGIYNDTPGVPTGGDPGEIQFLGCTTDLGGDLYGCVAHDPNTPTGLGATVNSATSAVDAAGGNWLRVQLFGSLSTPGGSALVDAPPGETETVSVLLGTLRMPDHTTPPTIALVEFKSPAGATYEPSQEVQYGIAEFHNTDADADLVPGDTDNCVTAFNPDQADDGGLLTTNRNGTGNRCECGEATGNGQIQADDVGRLQLLLAGINSDLGSRERCSVSPGMVDESDRTTTCDIQDIVMVSIATGGDPSKIQPLCRPTGL